MLLSAKIRLTSPIMGDAFARGRRIIRRPKDRPDMMHGRPDIWHWGFKTAFESLCINAEPESVRSAPTVLAPPTCTIVRDYKRGEEKFEAIKEGTVMQVSFVLAAAKNGKGKPVTVAEFSAALAFIGQFIGISHWGNDVDYGRFEVLAIETTTEFYHRSPKITTDAPHADSDRPITGDNPLSQRITGLS